jgi:Uma2 family endonuclease
MATNTKRLPTDEELMALPKDGYKRELLDGEIVMSPAGSEHGRKITRFTIAFGNHVYQNSLGEVFDGQTGFRMKSGDVLSPDISFISNERLTGLVEAPEGFYEGAPDLAIEFLSPGESIERLKGKLALYFENGTRLTWVMNSKRRVVAVHRDVENPQELGESEELSGEEVVSGFRILVAHVFAGIRR